MTQPNMWKEALNYLALLQIELEERGGPAEDAELHNHILHQQTMLLKSFGLPGSIDFIKLTNFENIPAEKEINIRIEQLKEAATNYLLADVQTELKILENAKA